MYRIWHSTESLADYIIDHTLLGTRDVVKSKLYESDANNPTRFHTMPDHIRKILYLDAPDIIVELNNRPIFTIEISTAAGTGHTISQRFARIAASVENGVPAFYVYSKGAIIPRSGRYKWDIINPIIFKVLEEVMRIHGIPALLYYFPSDIDDFPNSDIASAPNFSNKGLRHDKDIAKYPACPDSTSPEMANMFAAINKVLKTIETKGLHDGRAALLHTREIAQQRDFMSKEFYDRAGKKRLSGMSPLSATIEVDTQYLLNFLSSHESGGYRIGELLRSRKTTVLYKANSGFRGDPYAGSLAAIDYLLCREGKTFEDRNSNLVMVFGKMAIDDNDQTITITNKAGSTIQRLFKDVKACAKHNLLTKDYAELKSSEISRYYMQMRYGSTYSKVKHIRVFSHFADAILFPDGALWRDG